MFMHSTLPAASDGIKGRLWKVPSAWRRCRAFFESASESDSDHAAIASKQLLRQKKLCLKQQNIICQITFWQIMF